MSTLATVNLPPRKMTVEEYYELEERSEQKHEFRNGERIAMAGGSIEHARIAANFIREAGNALKGKPCAIFGSDLRIRVERRGRIYYPDASILCGEPRFDTLANGKPGKSVTNPRVLIQVLSPSTIEADHGEKFDAYRELDSFEEYVLISQDSARVSTYRRHPDGSWRFQVFVGLEAAAKVESVGVAIPLKEIYAGVSFPPKPNPAAENEAEGPPQS